MADFIESPAGWRGAELLTRADASYRLTEQDIAELERALGRVESKELELEDIGPEDFELPCFSERLRIFQDSLENGSGALRVLGLPIERYSVSEARRLFWGLGSHIGTPISQSARGERIFDVRDAGYRMGQPEARGPNTSKSLSFHTDRCDVIAFLCFRQARSGGENYLASAVTLHNTMLERHPELLEQLYQPFYYKRHNVDTGNARGYCQQPIFAVHDGVFVANVLRVLIERAHAMPELPDLSDEQRAALDMLDELAADPSIHVRFRQRPGDMLFVNNFMVFHSRSAFEDFPERERRRHLLRLWLSVPNSRPLPPAFAAHYGATAAGALRGGMRKRE